MAGMTMVLIIGGVVVGLLLWAMYTYNGLVRLKTLVDEAWSGIDVQLKRRYDLIPNLVSTIKGYSEHEKEIFTRVAEYRAASMGAQTKAEKIKHEGELSQALGRLFAIAEQYPELKANQNFMQLQNSLQDIERELQLARRYYNGTARNYNRSVQTVPTNMIASVAGFAVVPYFELDQAAQRENPQVKF